MDVGYIGYAECDNCFKFVYYNDPSQIDIWYHEDDPCVLAEVKCTFCGHIVVSRIAYDHMANFRRRGCVLKDLNDKFPPLTEQEIDEWDIDAELLALI